MAEQGQPAVSAPSEASAPAPQPVPGLGGVVLGPVTHATPAQHIIVEGDDLHLLAAYYYGNARLWRLIYEANRNVIPNPNKLTKGITITIPAPPV
jgi:nucleoid-associated protein YgaU